MQIQWQISSPPAERVESFSHQLGQPALVAKMLLNRGVETPEAAWKFLHPQLSDLHDPFRMKGMEAAVQRLLGAIAAGENILIYGDYDVDGITSTVVLKRALEMLGGRVSYYIPQRLTEGYGIRPEVLQRFHRQGIRLAVTVDSGIRAFEACHAARELGMEMIVTDHHLPDDSLPQASVIVNPLQPGCQYPDKNLAAVGVVFKLVQGLFSRMERDEIVPHFLKLVAIGTVADMVPLVGENRIIVRYGLQGLARPYNLGLQALLSGAGVNGRVRASDLGFKVIPRMNAFTRMGGGSEVVELFSTEDPGKVYSIVKQMNERNRRRRREEARILSEIEELRRCEPDSFQQAFLLVAGEGWHRGVIGNVAARLVERYQRPALVLSLDQTQAQGSGRSMAGFHLLNAMDHCVDVWTRYGGHAQAVGCTVEADSRTELLDKVRTAKQRLQQFGALQTCEETSARFLPIEALLEPGEITVDLFEAVERLSPFGTGNPVPIFASRRMVLKGGPWLLKEEHLKFRVGENGSILDAIWWRNGRRFESLRKASSLDLAYNLTLEEYQGVERLFLTVKDARPGD